MDEPSTGTVPRCYFCGKVIAEKDVQKTKYEVGHGHTIMVMICPACQRKKDRGEGPFAQQTSGAAVFGTILIVALVVAGLIFGVPAFLEWKRADDAKHKQFDDDWNRRRQ